MKGEKKRKEKKKAEERQKGRINIKVKGRKKEGMSERNREIEE